MLSDVNALASDWLRGLQSPPRPLQDGPRGSREIPKTAQEASARTPATGACVALLGQALLLITSALFLSQGKRVFLCLFLLRPQYTASGPRVHAFSGGEEDDERDAS